MNKIVLMSFYLITIIGANKAMAASNISDQLQLLNNQLQVQMQRVQSDMQDQLKTMNKQIQTQLKQMQDDNQKQVQSLQNQMEQLQKSFQKQLQQVYNAAVQGKEIVTDDGSQAAEPKPSKPADNGKK